MVELVGEVGDGLVAEEGVGDGFVAEVGIGDASLNFIGSKKFLIF